MIEEPSDPPEYMFSVFTCTYNRADTLMRTFEGLQNQTFKDFEWIVFDNGSTDNTQELLADLKVRATFPVQTLHWSTNTGFQNTFNEGVNASRAKFWLLLDSDDTCIPEALERFNAIWESIPEQDRHRYTGVTVLCVDQHGALVGKEFPQSPLDSHYTEMTYRYRSTGEKWGFNRVEALKENPFPTVENHVNPGLVWRAIGDKYLTRYVNERLRIYYINEEGREDQLTFHNAVSPHTAYSRRATSREALNRDLRFFRYAPHLLFKKAIVYGWFSDYLGIGLRKSLGELSSLQAKLLALVAYPAGKMMNWYSSR